MKVGTVVSSISRRAGGLFWSVRSLVRGTKDAGCEISVFAPSDEFAQEDLAHWHGLDVRLFSPIGPAAFSYSPGMANALSVSGADLVHVHGLWMYPSLAALRWSRQSQKPIIVSPRGMLDPWAVLHSHWKKRIAGWLYENAHLRSAACIHALCEAEYQAIRAYGLRNPVAIIPNAVDLPSDTDHPLDPKWPFARVPQTRVLLFLSRLHPKKGLPILLQAWQQARQATHPFDESWQLAIAGWDQGGHRSELEHLAKTLGIEDSVHFLGPRFDEQKAAVLRAADAYVLPSFSEGLPMAVLEAWSYGLPVLMTPQCNLPEGFQAGAALRIDPEPAHIAQGLTALFTMSDHERTALGERGRALIEQCFTWPRIAQQMLSVYRWVLGQGERPDCVITD